jgi:hypothetical protein
VVPSASHELSPIFMVTSLHMIVCDGRCGRRTEIPQHGGSSSSGTIRCVHYLQRLLPLVLYGSYPPLTCPSSPTERQKVTQFYYKLILPFTDVSREATYCQQRPFGSPTQYQLSSDCLALRTPMPAAALSLVYISISQQLILQSTCRYQRRRSFALVNGSH